MSNRRLLKFFVRYDGQGRVVLGSLIARQKMPKVGKWIEIEGYQCCNSNSNNANLFLTFLGVPDTTDYVFNLGARTIDVSLAIGTDVSALIASLIVSSTVTSVKVGGVDQISDVTPNNFTNPVIYTVVSEDGVTTANWIVTVTLV